MTGRADRWGRACRVRIRLVVLACALGSMGLMGPAWAAAASDAIRHFSIRSQDLSEALKALSAAADEQLLFSADLVADKRSPPLNGRYTFTAALEHLLEGSGLTVDRTKSGVALVVRETPR